MEAITILATENKKELINILFNSASAVGKTPTGVAASCSSSSSIFGSKVRENGGGTSNVLNLNRQYLKQLSKLLISEDAGI